MSVVKTAQVEPKSAIVILEQNQAARARGLAMARFQR
jgi:hypothetical protein